MLDLSIQKYPQIFKKGNLTSHPEERKGKLSEKRLEIQFQFQKCQRIKMLSEFLANFLHIKEIVFGNKIISLNIFSGKFYSVQLAFPQFLAFSVIIKKNNILGSMFKDSVAHFL